MKKLQLIIASGILLTAVLMAAPSRVQALLNFGNGFYTNLCGTGTAATEYIRSVCPANCSTGGGFCDNSGISSTDSVAKFTCDGQLTDCRSNEVWGTSQSLGDPGCNKTVQIDAYDKRCRDGSGNWTCSDADLKGYMVWFSGACVAPTATPTPVFVATPTPTSTPTQVITPTPAENNVVECPSGTVFGGINGSNIICVQQSQTQTQSSLSTSNASTGAINITLAGNPQSSGITPVKTVLVAGATELPKTGLPLAAWSLGGLFPLGIKLRKWGHFAKKSTESAHYLWQKREWGKG